MADPFAVHLQAGSPVMQRKPLAEAIARGGAGAVEGDEAVGGAARGGAPAGAVAGEAAESGGSGQPLPDEVRQQMELAFGVDFSAVRIHEGARATQMGALAYTQGTDIHFAPGQYQPHSKQGQELLGHELAHVVQQAQGRVKPTSRVLGAEVNEDAGLEREADEQGSRAASGEQVGSGGGSAAAATGGEAMQFAKVNMAVPGNAVVTASGGQWMIVQGLDAWGFAKWHLTIFPSGQESWKGTYKLPASGTRGIGAWMEYAEFHLTSPEKKHFYYTDGCVPLNACMATGARSPAWTDADWQKANAICAGYFRVYSAEQLNQYCAAQPELEKAAALEKAAEDAHLERMWNLFKNWVKYHPEMFAKENTTLDLYIERLESGFQGTHAEFREQIKKEELERGGKLPVYPKRRWVDDGEVYGYVD